MNIRTRFLVAFFGICFGGTALGHRGISRMLTANIPTQKDKDQPAQPR